MSFQGEVELRSATLADAASLAELLRALGMFAAIADEPRDITADRVRRHLDLCLSDASHNVYVAAAAGGVVAYCSVHWVPYLLLSGPEGFVSELFVRQEWRSRSLGARLLEVVRAEAERRGCSRLSLLNLRGRESYQRRFYEKQGWRERGEAANFLLGLPGSA